MTIHDEVPLQVIKGGGQRTLFGHPKLIITTFPVSTLTPDHWVGSPDVESLSRRIESRKIVRKDRRLRTHRRFRIGSRVDHISKDVNKTFDRRLVNVALFPFKTLPVPNPSTRGRVQEFGRDD